MPHGCPGHREEGGEGREEVAEWLVLCHSTLRFPTGVVHAGESD